MMCSLPSSSEFPRKAQAGQDPEQHKQKIIDPGKRPFLTVLLSELTCHPRSDHLEGVLSPLQPAKHQTKHCNSVFKHRRYQLEMQVAHY
jgi:hypothetical protein